MLTLECAHPARQTPPQPISTATAAAVAAPALPHLSHMQTGMQARQTGRQAGRLAGWHACKMISRRWRLSPLLLPPLPLLLGPGEPLPGPPLPAAATEAARRRR